MFKYETHLHTYPVSRCGQVSVLDNLKFYKKQGYDGVFITNHFLDGNINIDGDIPYQDAVNFYFSDYEEGVKLGKEIGIKVFLGVELSYSGTDFLVYGLNKEWFLSHPEIMDMKKRDELDFLIENGAFVIQAHPYREAGYIDHIRLFPRNVHGVEVMNACCNDLANKMAEFYAENYQLLKVAGSDNHIADRIKILAGVYCDTPICDEQDFINKIKNGKTNIFTAINE